MRHLVSPYLNLMAHYYGVDIELLNVVYLVARVGHGLVVAGAVELEVHKPLNELVVARWHTKLELGRVAALLRDAVHALA